MMETVIDLISTVGFPIVAFLLMWHQSNTVLKKNTEALNELRIVMGRMRE